MHAKHFIKQVNASNRWRNCHAFVFFILNYFKYKIKTTNKQKNYLRNFAKFLKFDVITNFVVVAIMMMTH